MLGSLVGGLVAGLGIGIQSRASADAVRAQNAAAEWNAAIAEQNALYMDDLAATELLIGERNAGEARRQGQAVIGAQRAITSASGVKVDMGSPADVQAATRGAAEYDAQTHIFNALLRERQLVMQANNYRMQAQMSRATRQSTGMAAALPILSGVTGMIGRYF